MGVNDPGEHDQVTAVEGWGFTGNSRKAHYFRDGTSLCGRWGFRRSDAPHEPDSGASPYDCVGCRRALDKERACKPCHIDAHRKEVSHQ